MRRVLTEDIFERLLQRRAPRAPAPARTTRTADGRAPAAGRAGASDVDVRAIRAVTGLSQAKFAELLSIEVATLRNWEQGRREPTGAARALLRAIRNNPVAVIEALSD